MEHQRNGTSTPTLPELPPKAKLKFDHLDFRLPGNASAEKRARDLSARINELKKEE